MRLRKQTLGSILQVLNVIPELHDVFYLTQTNLNVLIMLADIKKMTEVPNGTASIPNRLQDSSRNSVSSISTVEGTSHHLFAEKLVPLLVDLFLQAPAAEKYNMFPDIVQSLGRWGPLHGFH